MENLLQAVSCSKQQRDKYLCGQTFNGGQSFLLRGRLRSKSADKSFIEWRSFCHRKVAPRLRRISRPLCALRTARAIASRCSVYCTPVTHWELLLRFSDPFGGLIHAVVTLAPLPAPHR